MYVDTFSDDKVETKRRAGTKYISDNRERNDKRNPSYTFSTMNNIFHDKVEVIFKKNFLLSNSGIRHQVFRTARIGPCNCSNH